LQRIPLKISACIESRALSGQQDNQKNTKTYYFQGIWEKCQVFSGFIQEFSIAFFWESAKM
jgi:hypothetical protein